MKNHDATIHKYPHLGRTWYRIDGTGADGQHHTFCTDSEGIAESEWDFFMLKGYFTDGE